MPYPSPTTQTSRFRVVQTENLSAPSPIKDDRVRVALDDFAGIDQTRSGEATIHILDSKPTVGFPVALKGSYDKTQQTIVGSYVIAGTDYGSYTMTLEARGKRRRRRLRCEIVAPGRGTPEPGCWIADEDDTYP